MKKSIAIAVTVGMSFIAAILVAKHYLKIPDYLTGFFFGLAIAIMLLPLITRRVKPGC